ncbi:hypothetical protein MUP01_12655 [Candidatus Bathyarchaeota archaeon]|nr:hypothetical protein [Candidatus Bathyarchaeota archaeon]
MFKKIVIPLAILVLIVSVNVVGATEDQVGFKESIEVKIDRYVPSTEQQPVNYIPYLLGAAVCIGFISIVAYSRIVKKRHLVGVKH